MPTIDNRNRWFTVIATLEGPTSILDAMVEHAETGLTLFRDRVGFIGGALHRSSDGERILQYLQWVSKEAYRDSIDDPAWDELPTTGPFLQRIEAGEATLDVRTYTVLNVADRPESSQLD